MFFPSVLWQLHQPASDGWWSHSSDCHLQGKLLLSPNKTVHYQPTHTHSYVSQPASPLCCAGHLVVLPCIRWASLKNTHVYLSCTNKKGEKWRGSTTPLLHTLMCYTHVRIYTYIYTHTYIYILHTCMYTYIYLHIHVYTYTYYMHTHTHTYIYIYIYIYIHAQMLQPGMEQLNWICTAFPDFTAKLNAAVCGDLRSTLDQIHGHIYSICSIVDSWCALEGLDMFQIVTEWPRDLTELEETHQWERREGGNQWIIYGREI